MNYIEFIKLYESETENECVDWRSLELSEELCNELLDKHFPVESLLLAKKLPLSILTKLAQHSDEKIRRMVADKRIAKPLLETLAHDTDVGVRIRVCYNANCTKNILIYLSSDQYPEVQEAAKKNLSKLIHQEKSN